jgi:hypothetical protein
MKRAALPAVEVAFALAAGVFLLTLPGMLRLPRPGWTTVEGVTTLGDALLAARTSGLRGWPLVAFVQRLAARKFAYSRRNPWDTPARAFERGMGYCQQQALALNEIYQGLGITSRPVYAMRCSFPSARVHGRMEPPKVGGHVWLRVRVDGAERDVCCGEVRNTPGRVHFRVLSAVRDLTPLLQPVSHLGSVIENVRRDWLASRRATEQPRLADSRADRACITRSCP